MAVSICDVHTGQTRKDTTSYGTLSFPIACYEDNMNIVTVPIHWHDEYEYILAVEGTVTVLLNSEAVELQVGESVFINSGCLHGVKPVAGGSSVLRSLVISPRLIGGSSDSVIFQRLILPLSVKDAPAFVLLNKHSDWQKAVAEHMLLAWSAVTEESYDFENEARYQVARGMRILVDHLAELPHRSPANEVILTRIKQALNFIETHYSEDIGTESLTQYCSCSESVLLRNFRQIVGTTPGRYLVQYRLQKAAELLLTTDLRSGDIACACGFHDFSYFTKMFRQTYGKTPLAYRETGRRSGSE